MRIAALSLCLAMLACTQPPAAPAADVPQLTNVYERYAALSTDAAFNAKLEAASQHQHELDWMVGAWRTTVTVFATTATPESSEEIRQTFTLTPNGQIVSDDFSTFMVYDAFAERWITAGSEPPVAPFNTQTAADVWDGRTLVFEGNARLLGEIFYLRQTMTKLNENEFEIVNEQRTGDGVFTRVDAYHFVRTAPG